MVIYMHALQINGVNLFTAHICEPNDGERRIWNDNTYYTHARIVCSNYKLQLINAYMCARCCVASVPRRRIRAASSFYLPELPGQPCDPVVRFPAEHDAGSRNRSSRERKQGSKMSAMCRRRAHHCKPRCLCWSLSAATEKEREALRRC